MKLRTYQHVLALVVLSLASGCAFDSRPSLGWDKHAGLIPGDAEVSDAEARDAGLEADAEGDVDTEADAAMEAADAADVPDADTSDASTRPPVSCPTGLYAGQFACRVNAVPVGAEFEIDFTLEQSSPQSPEARVTTPILFTASGALMVADFAARLDCSTGVFHADITNGFAILVPLPVIVPFVGVVDGDVDRGAGAVAGDWKFELPPGSPFGTLGTCEGTWHAALPH